MIPARRFLMIRHGQTEANAKGVLAGSLETPLTARGRDQAQKANALLPFLPFQPRVLICSALSRARETAQILNEEMNLPLHEAAALGERSFGDWAGKPYASFWPRMDQGETPPGGESREAFFARVHKALAEILEGYEDPLIVAHGGTFDAFIGLYGLALEDVKNCELYVFEPDATQTDCPWSIRHCAQSADGQVALLAVSCVPPDKAWIVRRAKA